MTTGIGISWQDLDDALIYLKNEHKIMSMVQIMSRNDHVHHQMGLLVRVVATSVGLGNGIGWERARHAYWPSYGHRTMTGMIYRLIHELDESLSSEPPKPGRAIKSLAFPRA